MPPVPAPSLLDRVYSELGLDAGRLLPAATSPSQVQEPSEWRDVGEWLMLAERLHADRIFFVGDDPVVVFSRLPAGSDEAAVAQMYRRAWSMARPRCLFVDLGDELRVYALDAPPPRAHTSDRPIRPIDVVSRATDVQQALSRFSREHFESGAAFEEGSMQAAGRADRRLLRDVALATGALQRAGMSATGAHALIERAILVRYLEDRGILTEDYFEEVRGGLRPPSRPERQELLLPTFGPTSAFLDFLADARLTAALFKRLADDFNGDLFVAGDAAADQPATQAQLHVLRDLLTGAASQAQEPLFLWAYDFSVVPTSLVSTMYELFYNQELEGSTSSTHYTPPELVEYIVADVLSPARLDRRPRICDPACGSGIFLVEAFRRLARHSSAAAGRRLSSDQLRGLLLERVAGCDIDEAAVRLAAFNLYVAYLNYQSPQDIRSAGPLPRLVAAPNDRDDGAVRPLLVADSFSPLADDEPSADDLRPLPWSRGSFDVVVGNPPWTEPSGDRRASADDWMVRRRVPVGDRSRSQLFLWRTLDLLAPTGTASMLVSAKVLFNTRTTSARFRDEWLAHVQLERVINFSEVRRDFFQEANAPFALLRYSHRELDARLEPFAYETARAVPNGRRGSAALARMDRRRVDQTAVMAHHHLWKTYSAGDHRDRALVERLALHTQLGELASEQPKAQYGYQRARPDDPHGHPTPESWEHLKGLSKFESWGPIQPAWEEEVPSRVKFDPSPDLFLRQTLVTRRGINPSFGPHARLLDGQYAFRHHIYGIPLGHREEWEAQVAVGTVLSSVGRYWLYMVSGSWGTWQDEIRSEQLLQLPIALDAHHPATARMVRAARALPQARADHAATLEQPDAHALRAVLDDLDQAAFELFDLSPSERDLVDDFWASRQASADVPVSTESPRDRPMLIAYADAFRSVWAPTLGEEAMLDAHFYGDGGSRVISAVFGTRAPSQAPAETLVQANRDWADVLDEYAGALETATGSRLIQRGDLRAVTDQAIVVVKRNEARFWTASAARRDAEATVAQLMVIQAGRR